MQRPQRLEITAHLRNLEPVIFEQIDINIIYPKDTLSHLRNLYISIYL